LSQAEGEKNDAVALAVAEDWDAALLKLQSASEHLDEAEAKEAAFEETGIPQNLLLIIIGVVTTIVVVILLILFVMRKNRKKPRVEGETTAKPAKIGDDIATRLENLKGLLDKDLITKEEYEKRKNEILAQV
jgi:flagellar basal body-associated protein FliL